MEKLLQLLTEYNTLKKIHYDFLIRPDGSIYLSHFGSWSQGDYIGNTSAWVEAENKLQLLIDETVNSIHIHSKVDKIILCKYCHAPIEWVSHHWAHIYTNPRHPAEPEER